SHPYPEVLTPGLVADHTAVETAAVTAALHLESLQDAANTFRYETYALSSNGLFVPKDHLVPPPAHPVGSALAGGQPVTPVDDFDKMLMLPPVLSHDPY